MTSALEKRIQPRVVLEIRGMAVKVPHAAMRWRSITLVLALLAASPAFAAEAKRQSVTQTKPNVLGEQRDTLSYLNERLVALLGNPAAVATIHDQTAREKRGQIQEAFTSDPEVVILVATDSAGEDINLQRSHLRVNYDLPWNPNRLEQRFDRIHPIGQLEQCHLWNLVAEGTREGAVFLRLLHKLEQQREALGTDAVFDVIGRELQGHPLKELLIDAIRRNDDPEVRVRLDRVIQHDLDAYPLRELLSDERVTFHKQANAGVPVQQI